MGDAEGHDGEQGSDTLWGLKPSRPRSAACSAAFGSSICQYTIEINILQMALDLTMANFCMAIKNEEKLLMKNTNAILHKQ